MDQDFSPPTSCAPLRKGVNPLHDFTSGPTSCHSCTSRIALHKHTTERRAPHPRPIMLQGAMRRVPCETGCFPAARAVSAVDQDYSPPTSCVPRVHRHPFLSSRHLFPLSQHIAPSSCRASASQRMRRAPRRPHVSRLSANRLFSGGYCGVRGEPGLLAPDRLRGAPRFQGSETSGKFDGKAKTWQCEVNAGRDGGVRWPGEGIWQGHADLVKESGNADLAGLFTCEMLVRDFSLT